MNSEQFKSAKELVQVGFFDLGPMDSNGTDETIISAEWASISDDDFEQVATERHRTLDQQEAVIDAFKNLIINAKGELYIAAKARLGHGKYLELLTKMGVEPRTAQYYSKLARDHREELLNAKRVSHLSLRQWIKISQSPESHQIIAKIEAGKLEADSKAINAELEAAKQRAKKAEEDLEEERKAHSLFRDEVASNEQAYTALVQSLEQQLEQKPEPQKIIEYQDTQETVNKIASLEQQIKVLAVRPNIPPETQKEIENLQLDLKNAKITLDFYTEQNRTLAEKNKQLSEESRRTFVENIASVGQLRIKQEWQYATTEVQASLRKFHTKVPSEIDRESFEGEEHTRTYQTIEILEQTIALLQKTLPQASSNIVDETEAPIAFIEASKTQQPVTTNVDPTKLFEQYRDFVKSLANDTLWWRAPDSGIMDMEMTKDEHIQYTRQMLKNGEEFDDPYRIGCAVEGMQRTLGILK